MSGDMCHADCWGDYPGWEFLGGGVGQGRQVNSVALVESLTLYQLAVGEAANVSREMKSLTVAKDC